MWLNAALLTCLLRVDCHVEQSFLKSTEPITHTYSNATKTDVSFFRLRHFDSVRLDSTGLLLAYGRPYVRLLTICRRYEPQLMTFVASQSHKCVYLRKPSGLVVAILLSTCAHSVQRGSPTIGFPMDLYHYRHSLADKTECHVACLVGRNVWGNDFLWTAWSGIR